ncbi:MAG: MFS transporter [Chloroflexota bacterium]|nr:MFS transporter [Chloroflexota bacterium]
MYKRIRKIYYGWWISVAGGLNTAISSIPTFSGGSIIFKAIEDEFNWSRAVVSGVASFGRFGGALLGPIEGYLTDRFGPWKMILIGFSVASLGLFWLSTINTILFYYLSYLLVSVGVSIGGFVPSMSSVNVWMPHKRATAMSWVIGGSSFGGFFLPLMVLSIDKNGWRLTMILLAIIFLFTGPILAFIVRKRPDINFLEKIKQTKKNFISNTDMPPKEAIRTQPFWILAFSHLFANVSVGAISAHLFLYLTDDNGVGLDIITAGTILPIMSVLQFAGHISGGILGDIFNKKIILPIFFILQAIAIIILAYASNYSIVILFSIIWGIGFGMRTPTFHAMRGDFFGGKYYGTILGINAFPMGIAMMISPVIVGYIYDKYDTYYYSFIVMAALCIISCILISVIKNPKNYEKN